MQMRRPGKRGSVLLPGSELPARLDIQVIGSTFQGRDVNVGNNNVSIGTVHGNIHLSTATPTTHPESVSIPLANWLSPLGFARQQAEALERRTEGTFDWLLETPEFINWKDRENGGILLGLGKPGAGKTTFASFVIDYLQRQSDADCPGVAAVCYAYHQYHTKLTLSQLLELILKQLILQCPSANIDRLQMLKNQGRRPTVDELTSILQENFSQIPNIFIVLDAMDECFNEDVRHRLLSTLQSWNSAKVLITSRPIPTIQSALPDAIILVICPNTKDIGTHIRARTRYNPNLTRLVPKVSSTDLETKVVKQAGGMFLLVELHIKHLSEQTNMKAFRNALEALPNEASATYAQALERINQQNSEVKRLALYALSWVFRALRPLQVIELQYGIASTRSGCAADESELDHEELIISACAGLLVVSQDTKTVSFIHYTVREYIEQVQDDFLPQVEITKCCMSIISLPEVQLNPPSHPLIEYSASYWGFLVQSTKDDDVVMTDALRSLETPAQFATIWAATSRSLDGSLMPTDTSASYTHNPHPLHIAAAFGLDRIAQILLDRYPHAAGQTDAYGRTPLHFAAVNGHLEAVILLCNHPNTALNAKTMYGRTSLVSAISLNRTELAKFLLTIPKLDVSTADKNGKTPLWVAAEEGHLELVKLLAERAEHDIDRPDKSGITPLGIAARNRHYAVVQFLLDTQRVNVSAVDEDGRTPLWLATVGGHLELVKLLAEKAEHDIDRPQKFGITPLAIAAFNGHHLVVNFLLDTQRVNASAVDQKGGMPLWLAASRGHLEVVKLLAGRPGLDIDRPDKSGITPLGAAAYYGHHAVAHFLLDTQRVNANAPAQDGQTPLWAAAKKGHLEVIKLFAERAELDIDRPDKSGITPLGIAARNCHYTVVQFLLDTQRVNISAVDEDGRTPLWLAAAEGDLELVKLLAEHDIDHPDNFGITPLNVAARNGHHAAVQFLLDTQRVNVSRVDKDGRIPLWLAAAEGHLELVKLLAERAEHDIDHPDKSGITPLGIAARNCHYAVVQFLLDTQRVNASTVDKDRRIPLWLAAAGGHLEVVKLLAEKAECDIDRPEKFGVTPLGVAAFSRHYAVVHFLLHTQRVNASAVAQNGQTPLWLAASGGHLEVVKLLAEKAEHDIDRPDNFGTTPLAAASSEGHFAVVEFFVNTGQVDLNATDQNNETIFSLAASNGGSPAVVNLLLQTGKFDINAKDKDGGTALMFAAVWGRLKVVKLLLDLPTIDVHARDLKGHTAVFYAAKRWDGNPIAVLDALLNDPRIADNLPLHHLRPIRRTQHHPNRHDASPLPAQANESDPVCRPLPVNKVVHSEELAPVSQSDDTGLECSPSLAPAETTRTDRQNVTPTQKSPKLTVFLIGTISIFALALALCLTRLGQAVRGQ